MQTRRHTSSRLTLLFCAWLLAVGRLGAESIAREVESVGIPVGDLDRAVSFYRDVLTFREIARAEVSGDDYDHLFGVFGSRLATARLALGDEQIVLMQFLTPAGRPLPADTRSNDRWFQHVAIIVGDMAAAYARLRRHDVTHASTAPQRLPDWNPNAGGIEAFYFRDPDGNTLEILQFPAGKGADKWQRRDDRLFLGIDHTAIVVADTEESLRYYRDTLGLVVAGESDNHGPEQEQLNNVFAAHLRITALRAAAGPGIELLEYLAPQGGRPMPSDTRANDHWHWQVNVRTEDARKAYDRLRAKRRVIVSPTPVTLEAADLGFGAGLLVRDPDGHGLMLEAR
jgi:catechol 2,3-dioxygenase-like lactoylglutathione lyase family enzyme